jgi:hypothetical protein
MWHSSLHLHVNLHLHSLYLYSYGFVSISRGNKTLQEHTLTNSNAVASLLPFAGYERVDCGIHALNCIASYVFGIDIYFFEFVHKYAFGTGMKSMGFVISFNMVFTMN